MGILNAISVTNANSEKQMLDMMEEMRRIAGGAVRVCMCVCVCMHACILNVSINTVLKCHQCHKCKQ
jgi:hypothetical protein